MTTMETATATRTSKEKKRPLLSKTTILGRVSHCGIAFSRCADSGGWREMESV